MWKLLCSGGIFAPHLPEYNTVSMTSVKIVGYCYCSDGLGFFPHHWASNVDPPKREHLLDLLSAHLEALSKQYNFTL